MTISDWLYAIIVGAVQGVAEFLPISSSAHLIITSAFLQGKAMPLAINVSLHLGTLAAVFFYFKEEWTKLFEETWAFCFKRQSMPANSVHFISCLMIGSIPAGVVGILFDDWIEKNLHHIHMTLVPLAVIGILLWLIDLKFPNQKNLNQLSKWQSFLIGCFQALALFPGVSRSGSTIMGGRVVGLDRSESAKFSFLLGTPIMLAAFLKSIPEMRGAALHPEFYIGIFSSFMVGLLAIKFLMNFVKKFSFFWFALYRVLLALIIWMMYSN